jgi:flagellar hook assembly protein FlgD
MNSVAPPPLPIDVGSIKVVNSPFNPLASETMRIQYNFKAETNTFSCLVYDLKGFKRHTIAESLPVNQSGEITWDGRDRSGKALPRGIYILRTEAKNSNGKYFLRKQLTIVLATK